MCRTHWLAVSPGRPLSGKSCSDGLSYPPDAGQMELLGVLMSKTAKQWALFIAAAAAVLALDQAAKWLVISHLELGESWAPIPALSDYLLITRSYNTGAAFGMFPLASNLFLLLALITIIAFVVAYPRLPARAWLSRLSIALIAGGALSNAVDRIRFDHVIDYVHVQISPGFANISNFADHAITLGVILLLLDQWRAEPERRREGQAIEDDRGPSRDPPDTSSDPDRAQSDPLSRQDVL